RRTSFGPIADMGKRGSVQCSSGIAPHFANDFRNVTRDLWPMCFHLRKFGLGDQVVQSRFEAGPLARQGPPVFNVRPIFDPQIEKAQIIKPRRKWHETDIGETWIRAKDPRSSLSKRVLQ